MASMAHRSERLAGAGTNIHGQGQVLVKALRSSDRADISTPPETPSFVGLPSELLEKILAGLP